MSLPHLLLVDDSEAILAFERAALSGHYAVSTASHGGEALEKLRAFRPDAVLLDLSMPVMDGDEVLRLMQLDAGWKTIPVIVISSEAARAEACLKLGAAAYLPKPIRAEELFLLVNRVLAERAARERLGSLAVLEVQAGDISLALPLDVVRGVVPQVATRPIPAGPSYLCEYFELHGEPLCVLDLPERLGQRHKSALLERKLVILEQGGKRLALCVDAVKDPEEFAAKDVTPKNRLMGVEGGRLQEFLVALVRTPTGVMPVVDPIALISPSLLRALASLPAGAGPA